MFDILMIIKYVNVQLIDIKKQSNFKDQYITKVMAINLMVMAIEVIQEQVLSLNYSTLYPLHVIMTIKIK